MVTLELEHIAAIWLTPSDELLQHRICSESHFEEASARDKEIIQKFVGRALLYKEHMMDAAERFKWPLYRWKRHRPQ